MTSRLLGRRFAATRPRSPWILPARTQLFMPPRFELRSLSTSPSPDKTPPPAPPPSWYDTYLSRSAITLGAKEAAESNRWARVAPFFLLQGVTGSVYAWSVFNAPLCAQLGVVAPASGDWALGSVLPLFSVSAAVLGTVTATLGPMIDRIGPRASSAASAAGWACGLSLSAVACSMHSLPMLYVGYGLLVGMGWGFGYVGPISGLLAWFPDKRGLVQGLGMTSFGIGSLMAPLFATHLLERFSRAPEMVGLSSETAMVTQGGARFVEIAGEMKEVVVASAGSAAQGIVEGGVYLVGTGDSGVAMTFATLGATYGSLLCLSAGTIRLPPATYVPPSAVPTAASSAANDVVGDDSSSPKKQEEGEEGREGGGAGVVAAAKEEPVDVTASEALRTGQFWALLGVMAGNATAGLGIISSGKLLMSDCFAVTMPEIATPAACAAFVSALAFMNTAGRLVWGVAGDKIGRRNTLLTFAMTAPVCAAIPTLIHAGAASPALGGMPLYAFAGSTLGIIACYGGLFAVLPAYVADIFGPRHAGAIMGRLLCGYSVAAIAGPGMLAMLRARGDRAAVEDLASKVDPELFANTFGAGIDQLPELWEAKTVTIQNLMAILPPDAHVIDPTYTLYTDTFYIMSGLLAAAAVASWSTGPLSKKAIENLLKSRKAAAER